MSSTNGQVIRCRGTFLHLSVNFCGVLGGDIVVSRSILWTFTCLGYIDFILPFVLLFCLELFLFYLSLDYLLAVDWRSNSILYLKGAFCTRFPFLRILEYIAY